MTWEQITGFQPGEKKCSDGTTKARQNDDLRGIFAECNFSDALREYGIPARNIDRITSHYVVDETSVDTDFTGNPNYFNAVDKRKIKSRDYDVLLEEAKLHNKQPLVVAYDVNITHFWYKIVDKNNLYATWHFSEKDNFMKHLEDGSLDNTFSLTKEEPHFAIDDPPEVIPF